MKEKVRFLLVEDNEDHAELVKLAFSGGRVLNELAWVQDGEQALAYLRQQGQYGDCPRPHVVLLDMRLPKVSGPEVLQAIKTDANLASIAVVILTSSDAERDRAAALQMHANSYVVKPVDIGRLREIVERLQLYWSICSLPSD